MKPQEVNIRLNRIIFHIDVNSAFLSWEAVYRLTHKGGRTDLREMASDFQKPDRVHTLYPEEIREKMWPLPVSDLFFVGRATSGKLLSMGIRTIGELAKSDPAWLKGILKKQGEVIWAFANGIDLSPVLAEPEANKGYGNSTTIPFDVTDEEIADRVLLALSETVAHRLRADHVQAGVVSVGIRYADFSYVSHQRGFYNPTSITIEIHKTACRLFREAWNGMPVRHLSIHTTRIDGEESWRQGDFSDPADYGKLSRLDGAVDRIRDCFGRTGRFGPGLFILSIGGAVGVEFPLGFCFVPETLSSRKKPEQPCPKKTSAALVLQWILKNNAGLCLPCLLLLDHTQDIGA